MAITRAFVAVAALALALPVGAQPLSGAALVGALQHGGYVLVMRHAHAPEQPPAAEQADPANRTGERQLDTTGRSAALAMGAALRTLRLPIGLVWSSPTYRARETAQLTGLPAPKIASELGDSGHSMQAATSGQAIWLTNLANRRPRHGTDTVIVTQYPNIKAAFGDEAANMGDGEALVLQPAKGTPRLVGRITMDQWPQLAAGLSSPGH